MQKPSSYTTLRLLAVLLTAGVIVINKYLPPKVLHLFPKAEQIGSIYGPEHNGERPFGWIDEANNHFWCNYTEGDPYSCGWSVLLGMDELNGIDLSGFDGFNIVLHYKGNAPRLRPYIRDFDPTYSDINKPGQSSKVMATAIRTSNLNKSEYVKLREFRVAEWWVTQFDIPRQYATQSLNNLIVFGIDFNVHSHNEVRVEKIEAVGRWIKNENLYFIIISAWMAVVVLEVIVRFYLIRRKAKADTQRLHRLVSDYKKLELKKQEFEALSTTDVLTGVMNRTGIHQFLEKLFETDSNWNRMGLLIFDIDYFKKVNDQYGHDTGDTVLKEAANILRQNIRQTDIFGRWGGEEFILVCPQIAQDKLDALANKLRSSIEQHRFSTDHGDLKLTISIGGTIVRDRESFNSAFKRADTALYRAKASGRNKVQLECKD